MREVYVESGVGAGFDDGAVIWHFDPDLWGHVAQGRSVDAALRTWFDEHGPYRVVEAIEDDEQAFARDLVPAAGDEVARTLAILRTQRERSLALLGSLSPSLLDRDDPAREMPHWARWRTIRQTLWHICDTESRYYLPQLGLPNREAADDLRDELRVSHDHVVRALADLPRDLVRRSGGEAWTSTKLLRRLAWHERGELDAVDALLCAWTNRATALTESRPQTSARLFDQVDD